MQKMISLKKLVQMDDRLRDLLLTNVKSENRSRLINRIQVVCDVIEKDGGKVEIVDINFVVPLNLDKKNSN